MMKNRILLLDILLYEHKKDYMPMYDYIFKKILGPFVWVEIGPMRPFLY